MLSPSSFISSSSVTTYLWLKSKFAIFFAITFISDIGLLNFLDTYDIAIPPIIITSVIPQANPFKVTIDRVSFLNALKRVSVFSNPASSLVKLHLKGNEMVVSAQDIDFSTSAEEKIVCNYDGDELNIGFKATYLIEILSNINSEEILFELADPSRAGLIIPSENEENEDLLMLLMPMMLND